MIFVSYIRDLADMYFFINSYCACRSVCEGDHSSNGWVGDPSSIVYKMFVVVLKMKAFMAHESNIRDLSEMNFVNFLL